MFRNFFLMAVCALAWFRSVCVASPCNEVLVESRPNIVIILADDLGWRDIGPYGQDFAATPRLDALAKEGAVFSAAYSAGTVCSPTRAALMTGKYPARVNITDWIPGNSYPKARTLPPTDLDHLPLEETTLAEAVRAVGYATYHVGKWHLGGGDFAPEHQGFDVNIMGSHTGHPATYFHPYGNGVDGAKDHAYAVKPLPPGGKEGEYLTDRQAEEAAKIIRRAADADRPFLLYLPFYTVHMPLEAKLEDVERYRALKRERGLAGEKPRPVYAAMIESMDSAIGGVLDQLQASGVADNTLVIFTSDNGGQGNSTDNRPLRGDKRSVWEGGIRVPMIVRWPGVVAPGVSLAEPVITQDIFATACAAAGAAISRESATDSRSLVDLLAGRADRLNRDAIYWHFPHNETQTVGPRDAIRAGNWKLIEELEDGSALLFDLAADPGEAHDLSGSKPEKAAELLAMLHTWRQEVGARMPTTNPAFEQWTQLFNGKNLDGWTPKIKGHNLGENFNDTFRVEDGVLKVSYDKYKKFDNAFGHLFYKKQFSHYVLRIEYRFVGEQLPDAPGWALRNSGVMLHCQSPQSMRRDQDFPVSIEAQFLGGEVEGGAERPTGSVCTPGTNIVMPVGGDGKLVTQHCINSKSKTYRGDQWVTAEIEVHGSGVIKHIINGETVIQYEQPQLDPNDADAALLMKDGQVLVDHGYIAIQSESHPIEFRKIEIRELSAED